MGRSSIEQAAVLAEITAPGPDPVTPLIRLLRHPQFHARPPGRLTVWRWVGWLCLLLLAAGVAGVLVHGVLARALGWKVPSSAFLNYLSTHPSVAAVLALLFAPILEELGFRAFLSTQPKAVFIGLTFFLAYLWGLVHVNVVHVTSAYAIHHYFAGLWVLLPAGAVSLLLYLYAREPILAFFRRRGAWVFWISCIIFGAGHAADFTHSLVWWGFVLALPQFLVGVGLAYLRITFGLRWSIASHLVFDWLLVSLAWGGLVLPAGSAGRFTWGLAAFGLALFVLIYGLVVLARVIRGRW